jgi:hypothetical protein
MKTLSAIGKKDEYLKLMKKGWNLKDIIMLMTFRRNLIRGKK